MQNTIIGVAIAVLLAGCAGEKRGLAAESALLTMDEVKHIVAETDAPICSLNLQAGLHEHEEPDAKSSWGEFADYNEFARRKKAAAGSDFVQYSRRAALHRLLHVREGSSIDGQEYYSTLDDGIPSPQSFEEHVKKIDYWDARIREQHANKDTDGAAHNMRFCVINEKGGVARAAAQQFIFDGLEAGTLTFPDHINGFIKGREFLAPPFKQKLIGLATKAKIASRVDLAAISMMRDNKNAIVETDPRTAEAFWEERDAEIDAVLNFIENENFATPADQLKSMTSIDQSLRHLWSAIPAIGSHFENADEAKKMQAGISTRVMRVDAFNTAQLKEMLEGRGWITDAKDGSGAANDAWLIAQHADQNPDFQRRVLDLMKDVLDEPGVSKRNYAYLFDRVAGKDKKPQRFGTQGRCTGPGTWEPSPLEDPDNIDRLRADVGLGSLAEYKTQFKDICFEDQRQK